jgi:multidrug resistance protein, MATE family
MSTSRLHFDAATLFKLLQMSVPMVISQGAFGVMIFTDRYLLGQIGPAHMAAAMGGGVACYFSYSLFNGILAYANALVAQYRGASESAKCSKVVTQGVLLAVCCIPLLAIIALGMRQIFAAMDHSPQQAELELVYYDIMMLCTFPVLVKICLASFFSGIGNTRTVMICDVLSILVNIPLAYGMIFGAFGLPELGMAGAAWATVISNVCAVLFYLVPYFARTNRIRFHVMESFAIDNGILRRYLRLGFPSGLELFLNIAAFNMFLLMFHSYGLAEAAAATIVFNWDILSFVPLLGLNIAVMSLVGHAVGSGDLSRVNAVMTAGYVLGIGYSFVLATIYIIFRNPLVDMFIVPSPEAEDIRMLARFMMVGLSCYVLCEGVLQVVAGVLRGAGDTRWIMFASVSLHWIMLALQFVVIRVLDYGPRASWMGFVVMILMITVVFGWRLLGNKWRDPERLRAVMAE